MTVVSPFALFEVLREGSEVQISWTEMNSPSQLEFERVALVFPSRAEEEEKKKSVDVAFVEVSSLGGFAKKK